MSVSNGSPEMKNRLRLDDTEAAISTTDARADRMAYTAENFDSEALETAAIIAQVDIIKAATAEIKTQSEALYSPRRINA